VTGEGSGLDESLPMNPDILPVLETRSLTKRFRHVVALDSVDLAVHPGEVFALLGSNGSGKSTTFRLLLNIYRPTAGESSLLGVPSTRMNGTTFEKVGYISEGQKMPQWMSVARFLDYCAGFYPDWDAELCRDLVNRFGLTLNQKIRHLSRGQRMKLSLASTLPAHPRLLLLDEPFSGLDVETRAALSGLLRTLALDSGLAIVITTHDVEEIEPVATRLGILRQGKLIVNESLRDYLGRHRFLQAPEDFPHPFPEELARDVKTTRTAAGAVVKFTDTYSTDLEDRIRNGLPSATGITYSPMTLREILAAHALPWS
jgi:ABC-2 type transport system ATP-binding protein